MNRLMIAGVVASAVVGLASAAYAHRRPPPPPQDTRVECPSVKHWQKCLWEETERTGGGRVICRNDVGIHPGPFALG